MSEHLITLSKEQFHRLDTISRLTVGLPLVVFDVEAMRGMGDFLNHGGKWYSGFSGDFPTEVLNVPAGNGEHVTQEMRSLPHIANSIDLRVWASNDGMNPAWLDYSQIPRELVYDFLLHHEIGHILYGDDTFIRSMIDQGKFTAEEYRGYQGEAVFYRTLIEYRADRYAWEKIRPGVKMPVDHPAEHVAKINQSMRNLLNLCRIHYDDLEQASLKNITPISLNPDEYIPAPHADNGNRPPLIDNQETLPAGGTIEAIKAAAGTRAGKLALAGMAASLLLSAGGFMWLNMPVALLGAIGLPVSVMVFRKSVNRRSLFAAPFLLLLLPRQLVKVFF